MVRNLCGLSYCKPCSHGATVLSLPAKRPLGAYKRTEPQYTRHALVSRARLGILYRSTACNLVRNQCAALDEAAETSKVISVRKEAAYSKDSIGTVDGSATPGEDEMGWPSDHSPGSGLLLWYCVDCS